LLSGIERMKSSSPSPARKQTPPTFALFLLAIAFPLLACRLIYVGVHALISGKLSIDLGDKYHHIYATVSRVSEPEKFWGFWSAGAAGLVVVTSISIAAIYEIRRRKRLRSQDVPT
jgi:hypothetical protein